MERINMLNMNAWNKLIQANQMNERNAEKNAITFQESMLKLFAECFHLINLVLLSNY